MQSNTMIALIAIAGIFIMGAIGYFFIKIMINTSKHSRREKNE